jgi:sucrose-phosphate synthase
MMTKDDAPFSRPDITIATEAQICLVSDIDGTLVIEDSEDQPGLEEFAAFLKEHRSYFFFAVATGRDRRLAIEVFAAHGLPYPDVIIASVGTEIFHGRSAVPDADWTAHINIGWQTEKVSALETAVPGLRLQEAKKQGPYKVSFYIDPGTFREERLVAALKEAGLKATIVLSQDKFLDLLPERASKGAAILYLCERYAMPLSRTIVFGDSGNDCDMLLATGQGVVVKNHAPELDALKCESQIFFSDHVGAAGVLDGMRHYQCHPMLRSKG